MAVNIYDNTISGCYIGEISIKAIYQGDNKLYPNEPFNGKFLAYYSDRTSYSAACDTSTTLTQSEVRSHSTSYYDMTKCWIGDCVEEIGDNAFSRCSSLKRIDIPSNVITIGYSAFQESGLNDIVIPDNVTTLGNLAFYKCYSLRTATIGSGVTNLNYTFSGCTSLQTVSLPNTLTTLGNFVFNNCRSLQSIEIPSGVTSILQDSFRNCTSLTSITIHATTPPTLGSGVFTYTNNCPIYVPSESVEVYKAASGWSSYASRIQAKLT